MGDSVETFGFGISGWGTLHSAHASQVLSPLYDIDVVVYVFVENDLGDNAYVVQAARGGRRTPKAYAVATSEAPGYAIRWVNPPDDLSPWYRIGKELQNRLLVAQLLWNRFQLLRAQGVVLRAAQQDREMTGIAGEIPNQNDLPATWPETYADAAQDLGARILRHWVDDTRAEGRRFVALYVPRGEAQIRGELPTEETWLPWLRRTTKRLGVPLIDPSQELGRHSLAGTPMYDDHWSPEGHRVIAEVLEQRLRELVPSLPHQEND